MSNLNGRLKQLEDALPPPKSVLWFQDKDPLVLFCIRLRKHGIELSNNEFTQLTGLAVPVELSNQEIEAYLIELALSHDWPEEPETPLDYLVDFFTWWAIKKAGLLK